MSAVWRLKKGTKKTTKYGAKTIFGGSSGSAHSEIDNFNQSQACKKNNHIHMHGMQKTIFLAKQRGWAKGADYGESPGGLQDLS